MGHINQFERPLSLENRNARWATLQLAGSGPLPLYGGTVGTTNSLNTTTYKPPTSYPIQQANYVNSGNVTPVAPQPPVTTSNSSGSNQSSKNALFQSLGLGQEAPVGWNGPAEETPVDPYAELRNEISSAWDSYLASLGGQEEFLNTQRTAQEDIVNTNYTGGVEQVNTQKAKSLRDIAAVTRNALQAGNNYLGSLGAGDSSANKMYTYATGRQAQQQTGSLNEYINSQLNQYRMSRDNQLSSIASWFAGQQNAIKTAVAQGTLNKGTDLASLSRSILDRSIAAMEQIRQEEVNRKNSLLAWAANNSTNYNQLQSNISKVSSLFQPGQILSTGGYSMPLYGGYVTSNGLTTDSYGNRLII